MIMIMTSLFLMSRRQTLQLSRNYSVYVLYISVCTKLQIKLIHKMVWKQDKHRRVCRNDWWNILCKTSTQKHFIYIKMSHCLWRTPKYRPLFGVNGLQIGKHRPLYHGDPVFEVSSEKSPYSNTLYGKRQGILRSYFNPNIHRTCRKKSNISSRYFPKQTERFTICVCMFSSIPFAKAKI